MWPRAVASLSVEHRRPGDRVSVGKLAVPVVLQCVAGVANASGCAICLLLDRSTVACPHTASAAMRLADDHDGVRGGDEAAGAVWTRKGPLPCVKLGSSPARVLVRRRRPGAVCVRVVSGSRRRVGIASRLDPS